MSSDPNQHTGKPVEESDPRIGDLLSEEKPDIAGAALIGFPSDSGVVRNAGRPGAAGAPDQIRGRLKQLTPHAVHYHRHMHFLKQVFDHGDLSVSGDLKEDQARLSKVTADYLGQGVMPVIIGGGHETAYGHFLGYVEAEKQVSIVNIDAHTDVRPIREGKPHSGSPFRQALEHESHLCKDYSVFGLSPESVSRDHHLFVSGKGGELRFHHETDLKSILYHLNSLKTDHIMVTMDMDAVSQSAAPGVSAPAASGLSPDFWLRLAYRFGQHPKVTSFDLCEVNPRHDVDGQTVRLAALTIWQFLLGAGFRDASL